MGRDVIVIGAGGHALVVASTLIAAGYSLAGFYDDAPDLWGGTILGAKVRGPISDASASRVPRAIIAIGDNRTRKRLAEQLDFSWTSVRHPFSWVHPDIRLGAGTLVCAGAIVQPGASIGAHVILNTRTSVDHDAVVGDFAHLAAATMGGGAIAEDGSFLGIGSLVLPRVTVGAWATVGAGAVVVRDVRPGATVVALPARETISRTD